MATEKLFYDVPFQKEFCAQVLSCEQAGDKYKIEFGTTLFYPEGGGQGCDTGILKYAAETVNVLDVQEENGTIWHYCDKPIPVGVHATGTIDWDKRFDHMQQHSGEHIVSGMLCETFHCDNVGFHMGAESVVIDYNTYIPWEGVLEIEERANRYIWEGHEPYVGWPNTDELARINYRFKKAIEGNIRIVSFPGADTCACCGLHVSNSSQVGLVKFISHQKFKDGVRLEVLFGKRAYDYLSANYDQNREIAADMSTKYDRTFETYIKLKKELMEAKSRMSKMEDTYFACLASGYAGCENVLLINEDMEADSLRRLAQAVSAEIQGCVCAFAGNDDDGGAYKYVIMDMQNDISELVKFINTELNGRGGGRNGFAQGSVKCKKIQISNLDRLKNYSI